MKAKTLIACAITASALPFAALAQNNAQPSGPQGTGWYGAPNAAQPMPQVNQPWDSSALGRNDAYITERNNARLERRTQRERFRDRRAYDGFSADTNPPAPTY